MSDEQPVETPKSFYDQLAEAFVYPVKGHGLYLIIASVLFFSFVYFVFSSFGRIIPYAGLITIPIGGLLLGYICSYLLNVVGSSAKGEDEPPDFPDFGGSWWDLLRPLLFLVAACVVSFVLVGACNVAHYFDVPYTGALRWVCVGIGIVYLPMSVLAVVLFDSVAGLNPLVVVGGIAKVGWDHLVACGVMGLVFVLTFAAIKYVVPYVPLVGSLLGSALGLYLLMAEMRIIGLIYRYHEQRLGWFTVD